ncbi:MAG: DUF1049 domain-containing protein [Anaerolineae bacterium]|nr:MAG: DUF1049 domain-containing protein [Anaerolineae bacterium]
MATLYLILALLIAIVAVIFALQNTAAITISFFFWQVSGSLALVVLVTLVLGVLVGWLFVAPSLVKGSLQGSSQRKRIAALEKEVTEYKVSVEKLQGQIKTLEGELAAAHAAPPPVAPAPATPLPNQAEKQPQ